MSRPPLSKKVTPIEKDIIYAPKGKTFSKLEKTYISPEEFESMKLCCGFDHCMQDGAKKMNTSAATFHRLKKNGQKKVIKAILENKAIIIKSTNS